MYASHKQKESDFRQKSNLLTEFYLSVLPLFPKSERGYIMKCDIPLYFLQNIYSSAITLYIGPSNLLQRELHH